MSYASQWQRLSQYPDEGEPRCVAEVQTDQRMSTDVPTYLLSESADGFGLPHP